MDNTIENRDQFNTSLEPQVRSAPMSNGYQANQGEVVFFIADLEELFGIDLSFPGIRSALNHAFYESRKYIPVDTGLMKKSYTMSAIDGHSVEVFFDPLKIVGQERKGQVVKEYYPKWVGSSDPSNSAWNWLTIVMNHFYDTLIDDAERLFSAEEARRERMMDKAIARGDEERAMELARRQEGEITAFSYLVLGTLADREKKLLLERRKAKERKRKNDEEARKRAVARRRR